MSATGRSGVRRKADRYVTPAWVTKALLDRVTLPQKIVDAGCGTLAISRVLVAAHFDVVGYELPEYAPPSEPGVVVRPTNFLLTTESSFGGPQFSKYAVVMNPPYALAAEFIRRALQLVDRNQPVCALLRLNFLGSSRKRLDLVGPNSCLRRVLVFSRRPSFTGKGTDATEYAWFIWQEILPYAPPPAWVPIHLEVIP